MWVNLAVALLIGIISYNEWYAVSLFLVIIIHCFIKQRYIHLFISIVFLCVGFIMMHINHRHYQEFDWSSADTISSEGIIIFQDDLLVDGDIFKGSMKMDNQLFKFIYRIQNKNEQQSIQSNLPYFNACTAKLTLKQPLPNTNALKFNYDYFLLDRGITYTAEIDKYSHCHESNKSFMNEIQHYRAQLSDKMNHFKTEIMPFISALTLGDMRYMSDEDLTLLKNLGIYHLYAISGSHVALIAVHLYFLLKRFYIPIPYSQSIILLILPVYTILTGLAPSVLRSTLFIMIYILFRKKDISLLDALSLSFILLLVFDFQKIFDIGFQLSYFITFCLLLISDVQRKFHPLLFFILYSTIAHYSSVIILMYHFNEISWIGIVTNLIFVPLFTLIIFPICTLFLLVMIFWHEYAFLLLPLIEICFSMNDMLIYLFKDFQITSVIANQWFFIYLLLTAAMFYSFSQLIHLKRFLTSIAIFTLSIIFISGPDKASRVSFMDIGQGDSTIVESNQMTIMIDTGGKLSFKEPWQQQKNAATITDIVLMPYLKERGRNSIDFLILTHPDQDHFGEAEHLLDKLSVKHIIMNLQSEGIEKYSELIKKAKRKGTEIINQKNIDQLQIGETHLYFNSLNHAKDENDSSIVTRLNFGHKEFLLMADLSLEGESKMQNFICAKPVDVLKIGHHGSDTSTSDKTLQCTQPAFAVISAGRHNRFGHPHQSVTERIEHAGIKVLNTQEVGRISFENAMHNAKQEIKKARH